MYDYQFFDTKLGEMLAIADNKKLFVLEFLNKKNMPEIKNKFVKKYNLSLNDIKHQSNPIINQTIEQLNLYFLKKLVYFSIPLNLPCAYNTDFQNKVLNKIATIRYGETISYANLACSINHPKAYRAVANACGNNNIVIIIPCHRVLASNNKLGGYSAGIERKIWLLNNEQHY